MDKLDVVNEVRELKTQLAYPKKIGFFFGAGTSCALKIPDIDTLTARIQGELKGDFLSHFKTIRDDLTDPAAKKKINIEEVLNQARRIREIAADKADREYLTISGEAAKKLDHEICKRIYEIITKEEEKADLAIPSKFCAWLNLLNREQAKEIFTTNYDLIIERSLESSRIPYFDGFVGSFEPFFWQESIERSLGPSDATKNWIRVWKVHGSLNWFWKSDPVKKTQKIIRVGKFDKAALADQELVVYPSKEKYDSSRKQPFVAYFDRLQNYLLEGELFFVFSGYSFSDQHINEIVFNALRQNRRLHCAVFCFRDEEVEVLHESCSSYLNLSVFGPKKAIVNGALCEWVLNKDSLKDHETFDSYFDEAAAKLKLGDFGELVNFLVVSSGRAELLGPAK